VPDETPYPKAPITEALIDIRVTLPGEITLADLARVNIGEDVGYPQRRNQFAGEARIAIGEQLGATTQQTHNGYVFVSSDERQIVQVRLDGFTFSRLAPYDRWEIFQEEAHRLWTLYRLAAEPVSINRVAVRYINRLDLPFPMEDLRDYLRTVPEVSPALPQELSSYVMHLEIPQEDIGASPPDQNTASVLLDIDLFRVFETSIGEGELWRLLDQFRIRKNEVFEACITDAARELFRDA
jgi:uncharacterized protein (TIGR04255 family)